MVFPSLIGKLWDRSFKSSRIVSGFRATGLHPLDSAPVLCKLATSVPFRAPSSAPSTAPSTEPSTGSVVSQSASATASTSSSSLATFASALLLPPTSISGSGTVRLHFKGACNNCGAQLTPMRPHLTLHFEKLLQKKKADKKVSRKRVKPQYYG